MVQYAYKLISTRRALKNTFAANYHQDQEWGTASSSKISYPPDPNRHLMFSLLVEESYGALSPR